MAAPIPWWKVADVVLLSFKPRGFLGDSCHPRHYHFVVMVLPIFYNDIPLRVYPAAPGTCTPNAATTTSLITTYLFILRSYGTCGVYRPCLVFFELFTTASGGITHAGI